MDNDLEFLCVQFKKEVGVQGAIVTWLVLSSLGAAPVGKGFSPKRAVFDFGEPRSERRWVAVNDGVMGGVSEGRLRATGDGTVAFEGNLSLANNGGFASVRSRAQRVDLSQGSGLSLLVRGDGRRYKLGLKNDAFPDGVTYRAAFETEPGEWRTIRLRFADFVPSYRGRIVRDARPLDLARVASFDLMISDKQAGPFRLELSRIEAFED
jgi:hypothetical protein